jgi:hypothetical protein
MPTEGLTAVAVDDSGSIAVGGFAYVESASLTNPLQPVIRGAPDGFVAKLRHDVPAYVFASYLGGRGGDSVAAVALHDGCVYVAGATSSRDFPVTRAYQRVHGGGYNDGFVAAFAPDGRALQFSTYVGGSGEDAARGVAVAGDGAAYAIGRTDSADFPATDGAFDRRCGSDGRCNPTRVCDRRGYCATVPIPDIFVTSIDRVGGLRTSTFLGGGGNDEGRAIAVDASGRITIAGSTTSRDFDGIPPPLRCRAADGCHAFVAELSADLDVVAAAWRVPVPVRSGSDPVALARTRPDRLTITLNTSAGAVVVRAPSASGPIE